MKSRKICNKCSYRKYGSNNDYMREYMRTVRWLAGGPDNFLVGEKVESMIVNSMNGNLNMMQDKTNFFI